METRRFALRIFAAVMGFVWLAAPASAQAAGEVSGVYYDWQKTMQPERPWLHDYSQTLVTKIFLCSRDSKGNVDKVYLTFSDVLEVIRRLDNLTLGIPKIVYLVGWQFTGHDSGYPSWSVVNERLKRREDKTAVESLRWLMAQARQFHTTVSLHVNMFDAYENSPLWRTYDENNIILKEKDGTPIKGPLFSGMQSYQISYAQEWKLGYTQRRIDGLLEMLPELRQAGTIHIDAFHSIERTRPNDRLSSPYLGLTIEDELAAQRKIYRYFRTQGVDVTAEYALNNLRKDPFIGLQPMRPTSSSKISGRETGSASRTPSMICRRLSTSARPCGRRRRFAPIPCIWPGWRSSSARMWFPGTAATTPRARARIGGRGAGRGTSSFQLSGGRLRSLPSAGRDTARSVGVFPGTGKERPV